MAGDLHGHGTTLKVNDGTNTTTIGYITSISGPNQTRDSIDVSTMDSTGKQRIFIPGMLDAGESTFELNYDGTGAATANDLNTERTNTAQTWTVTFDDGGTNADSSWACKGFITALGHATDYEGKVSQSLTLKFSGVPTYTDLA
jgi:hypothetical protein